MSVSIFGFAQTPNTNNIATKTYRVSTTSSISNPQIEEAFEQIVYFDGLGRPIQKVAYQQSSSGKDIISHIEYDQMGRKAIDYLPYVRSNASRILDGSALTNNLQFYADNNISLTGNDYFSTTLYPFAEKKYDSSPLNRVMIQSAPGEKWAMGSNHEIKFNYQLNQTSDQVKYFKTSEMNIISQSDGLFTAYNISLIDNGFFAPNQLYKTTTKDENWTSGNNNTTIEFKNRLGQVILKRTFENNEKYDTYYVYDRYGNLSFVIPPKVDANNTITGDILDGLCYQYKYDYKNRLVEKKLPGKQWEYIVYDRLDRVVASGPTLNPFGENGQGWLISKYDKFNRIVYTAWRIENAFDTNTRKSLQHSVYNSSPSQSEVKSAQLVTINNVQVPYTNVVFPTDNLNVLSINYYDDYSHTVVSGNIPTTISNQTVMQNLRGLSTGSWVRVLTSSSQVNAETTYLFYDKYGRTIYSKTNNLLGGFTEVTSNLDFEGKPINTVLVHRLDTNSEVFQVVDEYNYLTNGKLSMHLQKVNDYPKEMIASYTYDELGNMISKQVGGEDFTNAIGYQKIDYKYNIRGWLTDINNVFDLSESIGLNADYFAFKINYEKLTHTNESGNVVPLNSTAYGGKVKPLFNGNIAETYWITSTDNNIRKYSYSYDDMNRLLEAFYQRPQQNIEQTNNYNEFIRYDKNGNITELKRNGATDGLFILEMDDLRYDYQPNSNFLLKVMDNSNAPQGFKDDSLGNEDLEDDYAYDAYGNLKIDQNKKINKIIYNHLNLPTAIYFLNGSYITYLYNANGVKIRKTVFDANFPNSGVAITDYQNGFQYLNNRLLFFPHAEGYVNYKEGIFSHVYQYKDHLGSIRLAFAKDPSTGEVKVLNEDHYYPFGLKHENYNTNIKYFEEDLLSTTTTILKIRPVPPAFKNELYNYKYNGKELQEEMGLNFYDYGARNYDAALGRWTVVDNKSELYFGRSPYIYALNTPIQAIDPDGNLVIFINGQHTGDGARGYQDGSNWRGTNTYWRNYDSSKSNWLSKSNKIGFDVAVMNHLDDYNAIYRDGSMGGFNNTLTGGGSIFALWGTIFGTSNLTASNRINGGFTQGMADAEKIIASLARDKEGNIVESIKIISHSMGGAYAKGYVKAILKYAKDNNIKGLIVAFEADFAPFQPDKQSAVKGKNMGVTKQYSHSEDGVAGNLPMRGAEQEDTSGDKNQGHSIFDFIDQVSQLPNGTYMINGIKVTIK